MNYRLVKVSMQQQLAGNAQLKWLGGKELVNTHITEGSLQQTPSSCKSRQKKAKCDHNSFYGRMIKSNLDFSCIVVIAIVVVH